MEAGRDWAYEGAVAQLAELRAGPAGVLLHGGGGAGGGIVGGGPAEGPSAEQLLRELLSAPSAEDAARLAAARLSRGRGPGASGGSSSALEPAAQGQTPPQIFYQRTPAPPGVWGLDPSSALRSYEERFSRGALGAVDPPASSSEGGFDPARAQYLGARESLRRFAERRLGRDIWRGPSGESGSEYSAELDSFFE